MDRMLKEYFDFDVMFDRDNFAKVLEGFWFTIKLSSSPGSPRSLWGLVLAVLRQTPGKLAPIVRWPTIAYIDIFRGVPLLLVS